MSKENNRLEVIKNIKTYSELGEFHNKVETNDPVLSQSESREITDKYVRNRNKLSFRLKRDAATAIANAATSVINRDTKIIGLEKIPSDLKGAIITSNHFSPFENTVIRLLTRKLNKKLNIISQTTNFAMSGIVGFLMNYADTVPISSDPHYLARDLFSILKEKIVEKGEAVLLYPEQEMWYNYRKPRPPKKGAYYYSSKLNVPVVSCFVEVIDTDKNLNDNFNKVKYVLHILGVLYPDLSLGAKGASEKLAEEDYNLKIKCYEKVYNKKLDYTFEPSDIAGFKGECFD